MKISKRQLRRLINEEMATINDETIEDVVMDILSDEGGAAGLEPIEAALEDLEDEDMSLPDEDIEDIIDDVTGVKRHADGDYIDTTQLESLIREMANAEPVGVTSRSLVGALKRGGLGAEQHPTQDDVVYIMTGDAQGITVRVLGRGR